jgi:UDP-perosamine 4-acetyltransferase
VTDIIIIGGGGHARVVADALRAGGHSIKGYVDIRATDALSALKYLGDDGVLLDYDPIGVALGNGLGFAKIPDARRQIFLKYKNAGFSFATVVHPAAIVDPCAVLEEGAQILAGAVLQSNVRIGCNVIVNTGAIINHDGLIGDHSHIATGAVLAGGVEVGASTLVGAGATIIQDITIGSDVIVAAGAVVVRDVPSGRVAGVPARGFKAH